MQISRSYTPTFANLDLDAYIENKLSDTNLHFLIKTYPKGTLTPSLSELKLGSQIDISNPLGTFSVDLLKHVQHIFLFAAGTGITPMFKLLQFINYICQKDRVKKKVTLLNFNKTLQDIIWREQLQTVKDNDFFQFDCTQVLSQDQDWNGYQGRINKELLENFVPMEMEGKKLACICGPIPFTKEAYNLLNNTFNFSVDEIVKFEG